MARYKVENIRLEVVNGQKQKLFDVRRKADYGWILCGTYSAPARTPKRKLIECYFLFSESVPMATKDD